MLTHRNIYFNALNSMIEFGLSDSDVYLHTLAMFHCNGWGVPYAVTGVGAKHVIVKKYEPSSFFDLATRERMTFACMPPTMINLAMNHQLSEEQRALLPQNVRIATAGSAPPMALIKAMQERLGWKVIQIYGLTETSPFLTVSKLKPEMITSRLMRSTGCRHAPGIRCSASKCVSSMRAAQTLRAMARRWVR